MEPFPLVYDERLNYSESVRYLYSLGNEVLTAKLGLERITRLLQALGNPHRACRWIHVAGTNGKGSTCAMIEAGLARRRGSHRTLHLSPFDGTDRAHSNLPASRSARSNSRSAF